MPGFTVTINQQDDAVNGVHNPQQGAKNIQTLANDPTVIGIVGPYNSSVAQAEIPVSNAAGLMQCSPANTNPGLTKPWGGADPLSLRPTNPTKIAYVRVATTDDLQGAAGADIAFNIAKATTAYVADDTQTYGKGLSDVFATQFAALGGKVLKRDGIPGTHHRLHELRDDGQGTRPAVRLLRRRDHVRHRPVPQADGPAGHRQHPARRR